MSENGITQEMWKDTLEKEYGVIEEDFLAESPPEELEYRKEVVGHLYGALQALSIPDELLSAAYHRDILKEVYAFWADEASRGDSVVDKPALAVDCTSKWLLDVRAEYRQSLLYDRFVEEHATFIAAERLKTPDEIIEDAWKITCYNDLVMLMESVEFEQHEVDALLTLENPLSLIYDEVLSEDDNSIMDSLRETAERVALERVEEMNHPFFAAEAVVQKYVDEFIEYHCEPMEDEPEPDDGMEP